MVEAILLDLDNTLLENDMRAFMRPYLARLSQYLADLIPPDEMLRRLNLGVERMLQNDGTGPTNEETFMAVFFEGLEAPREAVLARFWAFYEGEFDHLRPYVRSKPAARPLVEEAFRQGYRVVVATQPMFPLLANRKRLEWAGVGDFPYDLITSYETMHACKPHLAYYREIAERLGVPPHRCLMAGDSVEWDLVAAEIGMRTFWVTDSLPAPLPPPPPHVDGHGGLEDLLRFLSVGPQ
jgi:FMN phosphatase YigB (HAD superfamily)